MDIYATGYISEILHVRVREKAWPSFRFQSVFCWLNMKKSFVYECTFQSQEFTVIDGLIERLTDWLNNQPTHF